MNVPAAERAVADQHFIGDAFFGSDMEGLFNSARRQLNDLLDALKKLGSLALVGIALIAFPGDQMRGVPLGQECEISIKWAAVGADTDDSAFLADQALGGGLIEDGHAELGGNLGKVVI